MPPRLAAVALVAACGPSSDTPSDAALPWTCPQVRSVAQHCGPILNEAVYITLLDKTSGQQDEVALLGATSGNTCTLAKFPPTSVIDHVTSVAVLGSDVFFCEALDADVTGKLTRISLLNGAVTTSNLSCLSIASFDDKLFVKLDETGMIQEYASFELVQGNMPTPRDLGLPGVRLGAGENKIFSSSAMVQQIYAYDPSTSTTTQVTMPASGIHVTGLASQKGQVAILDGISFDQWIYSFDAETGASLGKVVAATQVTRVHGLSNACRLPAFE